MIKINFNNIENLIFDNIDLKNSLIKYKEFFDYYSFYKRIGDINKLKKLKIDLMDLIDDDDLSIIKKVLKDEGTVVQKIPYNITKNLSINLYQEDSLNLDGDLDYRDFCLFRNEEKIFITFWR